MKNNIIKIGHIALAQYNLEQDLSTIQSLKKPDTPYSEYTNGSWWDYPLINSNGQSATNIFMNDYGAPTEIGYMCQNLLSLINENFNTKYITMAKIRNLVNAVVLPHVDYIEFKKDPDLFIRILIPLNKCSQSYHLGTTGINQLKINNVYLIDASHVHSAANFSNEDRFILSIDMLKSDIDMNISDLIYCIQEENVKPKFKNLKSENKNNSISFYDLAKNIEGKNYKEAAFDLTKEVYSLNLEFNDMFNLLLVTASERTQELINEINKLKIFLLEKREFGERFNWEILEKHEVII